MPGKRTLFGRHEQQRQLTASLDAAAGGLATVVSMVGEPGVGKTALLNWTAQAAEHFLVLRATGLESEADLSYACLTTLLRPLGHLTSALAPARARAIASATAVDDVPTEPLAVCTATLDLIARAAEHQPLLLLLDDAQWLDDASLRAIRFVLIRLDRDRVATVVTRRVGERDPFADVGDLALRIVVDVLDPSDAAQLLAAPNDAAPNDAAPNDAAVPDGVAEHCVRITGGNPLALLALRAQLDADQLAGRTPIPEHFRPGALVLQRFGGAVTALTDEERAALLIVSYDDTTRPDVIFAALHAAGIERDALLALERAHIIDVGAQVRFSHPLLRSIAIGESAAADARRAHRALARGIERLSGADGDRAASSTGDAAVGWALQQSLAWHLAGAAEGPDAEAVTALGTIAAQAIRQGSPLAAARAWDRAAAHAQPEERAELLVQAARAFTKASMHASAADRFAQALREPMTTRDRASALIGYADTLLWQDTPGATRLAAREAANLEADVPRAAAQLWVVAAMASSLGGDVELAADHARHARAALDRADADSRAAHADPQRVEIDTIAATIDLYRGHERQAAPVLDLVDLLVADLDLETADEDLLSGLQHVALVQIIRERADHAERTCTAIRRGGRRLGVEGLEAFGNALAAELAWRQGRWADALALADVDERPERHQPDQPLTFRHAVAARVRAAQGSPTAVDDAEAVVRSAQTIGMVLLEVWARSSLGLAHLSRGDDASAILALEPAWELTHRAGSGEPGMVWWQGDLVDAYVRLGRFDDAQRLIAEVEHQASATGRTWARVVAARGRGLLGSEQSADAAFADAVAQAGALSAPFETGRSLLAWAERRRRSGERAIAKGPSADGEQAATKALHLFQRLGARHWAERAAALVTDGAPERASNEESPSGVVFATLTQAELRVAMAVGGGMTNREAADDLYLSVRTVDWHLGAVYRKLGVRSRSELAATVTRAGGNRVVRLPG